MRTQGVHSLQNITRIKSSFKSVNRRAAARKTGVRLPRAVGCFCLPPCLDQFWCQRSLLHYTYREIKRPERGADHPSTLSNMKNARSFSYIPPLRFHGVVLGHSGNFTFTIARITIFCKGIFSIERLNAERTEKVQPFYFFHCTVAPELVGVLKNVLNVVQNDLSHN